MRFDHICIMVSDLERSLRLWRDVLGFQIVLRTILPDSKEPGPNSLIHEALLDDIFKHTGARTDLAFLVNEYGAAIEIQQIQVPALESTPATMLSGYQYTGFHELGLSVTDIDLWFKNIRAAGYVTQTDYVFTAGAFGRSFLFYDDDGNLIQLREGPLPTIAK